MAGKQIVQNTLRRVILTEAVPFKAMLFIVTNENGTWLNGKKIRYLKDSLCVASHKTYQGYMFFKKCYDIMWIPLFSQFLQKALKQKDRIYSSLQNVFAAHRFMFVQWGTTTLQQTSWLRPMDSNWIETHVYTTKVVGPTQMTNRKGAHLALPLSTEIKKTAVWIGAMGLVARPSFLCCLIMFFVFCIANEWNWKYKFGNKESLRGRMCPVCHFLEGSNSCKPGFNLQDPG